MLIQGQVGPPSVQSLSPGTNPTLRQGQFAELLMSHLQPRFYENNFRGNIFSVGMTTTALSANTISLTATTTPILGIWNPTTSPINAVLLQATLQIVTAGNSAVVPGAFVWTTSIGNGAISTGLTPFNRKTLAAAGSQVKGFAGATALTGITNNLVIQEAGDFGSLVVAQGATGTPIISPPMVQNFDGGLIVPPGGVLALLNTNSTTTISVAGKLMWAEVPV